MPALDFVALVDGLWDEHAENTALLLEHQAYALQLDWQDRTVDPDDPEVAARRADAEARGIKPPARPPVVPMAHRPWRVQRRRIEEFADAVAPYTVPDESDVDDDAFLDGWISANYA